MANPKHVAKLMEGVEAWNAWRNSSNEKPDFSGVVLVGDSFDGYYLDSSDFSGATLDRVTFTRSICDGCSFVSAVLSNVMFNYTRLQKCNFTNAVVGFSVFRRSLLEESDFTDTQFIQNAFADVSLRNVRGLDGIHDSARNSIGIDTFFESGGLPDSFLRESGVPEEFIQYAASLVGKAIAYYSCFLSHSSKDNEFTRRLYNDLQGKNVRTWFAPEDLKIGDRIRPRIDESIRIHDKLVIILSANSVNSNWVETEVESALEREQKEGKDILFPIAIDEEGFTSKQPWAADIRRKRRIGDFRQWKSHDDYTRTFNRLVDDLKKSQPPIIMKGG
ncbi:MAG: hypothetical protein QOI58_378 [Thermoanaerobaculia bacterium]|jgi:uncharacterized protein YjbI with pentapeptide repeats|nr:hypothetical protein [Thermoanaerobaculia bacterium]